MLNQGHVVTKHTDDGGENAYRLACHAKFWIIYYSTLVNLIEIFMLILQHVLMKFHVLTRHMPCQLT